MATEKDKTGLAADAQKRVDEETDQGFRGIETDPTPNANYTVAGVTSGKPTPETDAEAAEAARRHAMPGVVAMLRRRYGRGPRSALLLKG